MSHWRSASGSAFGPLPVAAALLAVGVRFGLASAQSRPAFSTASRSAGVRVPACGNAADDRVVRDAFDARLRCDFGREARVGRTHGRDTDLGVLLHDLATGRGDRRAGGVGRAFVVDDDVFSLPLGTACWFSVADAVAMGAATASARTDASGSRSLRTNSPFGRGSGQAPSPEVRRRCTPKGRKSNLRRSRLTIRRSNRGSGQNRDNLPSSGATCALPERSRHAGSPAFASRPARSDHAAQPHHQGGDVRGPHAAPRRHRRPHRVPPAGRRRWRRDDDGRVLRGDARRQHRRTPAHARQSRDRPRAAAAHGCDPRRRRGGGRAARPLGPGRQPRGHEAPEPGAVARRSARSGCAALRRSPRPTSTTITRAVRRRCPRPRRRRVRRDRDPPRPQLPARARSSRRS